MAVPSNQERAYTRRMPAPSILDLREFQDYEFPAIPVGYRRSITPNYSEPRPYGSASGPLHYAGTGLQTVEFELDLLVKRPTDADVIDRFVRFCESAMVPSRSARGGSRVRDPTDLLLIWPNELQIVCKLTAFSENVVMLFNDTGRIRRRILGLGFTEIIDGVLDATDVRVNGSRRGRIGT